MVQGRGHSVFGYSTNSLLMLMLPAGWDHTLRTDLMERKWRKCLIHPANCKTKKGKTTNLSLSSFRTGLNLGWVSRKGGREYRSTWRMFLYCRKRKIIQWVELKNGGDYTPWISQLPSSSSPGPSRLGHHFGCRLGTILQQKPTNSLKWQQRPVLSPSPWANEAEFLRHMASFIRTSRTPVAGK